MDNNRVIAEMQARIQRLEIEVNLLRQVSRGVDSNTGGWNGSCLTVQDLTILGTLNNSAVLTFPGQGVLQIQPGSGAGEGGQIEIVDNPPGANTDRWVIDSFNGTLRFFHILANVPTLVMVLGPAGTIAFPNLPAVAPAAGSKEIYYDPGAANVAKYVP